MGKASEIVQQKSIEAKSPTQPAKDRQPTKPEDMEMYRYGGMGWDK